MPGLICYAELFPYNPHFEANPYIYNGQVASFLIRLSHRSLISNAPARDPLLIPSNPTPARAVLTRSPARTSTLPTTFPADPPSNCVSFFEIHMFASAQNFYAAQHAALNAELHGEKHMNAVAVPDIFGSARRVMYFVFPELQVKVTGQ